MPHKLTGDDGQFVEGSGRWRGVRVAVAGHVFRLGISALPRKGLAARVGLRCSGDAMTANVRKQGARLSGRAFALSGFLSVA